MIFIFDFPPQKKNFFPEKNKLTPWLELRVIETSVVTMMMKIPFAVPSAKKERKEKEKGKRKKGKDNEIQKKKSESHKNDPKMTERMRRRDNIL